MLGRWLTEKVVKVVVKSRSTQKSHVTEQPWGQRVKGHGSWRSVEKIALVLDRFTSKSFALVIRYNAAATMHTIVALNTGQSRPTSRTSDVHWAQPTAYDGNTAVERPVRSFHVKDTWIFDSSPQ